MFSKIIDWINPLRGTVQYLSDGDTFVVKTGAFNTKKIRLARVNTNEIANLNYGKTKSEIGSLEAKKWLSDLIKGKDLICYGDGQAESYDRFVAWVYIIGIETVSLSHLLVQNGWAKVAYGYKNDDLQKELQLLENQAKAKNLGNWENGIWRK